MKWFMALTYWLSRLIYPAKKYRRDYLIPRVGLSPSKVMFMAKKWTYKYDPLRGLFNLIYPLDKAMYMNKGDCDDYAAKLYYNLQGGDYEPFLITYFTYDVTKAHTVVAIKLKDGRYRLYNWSNIYTRRDLDKLQQCAVGNHKVFSTVFTRWNSDKFRWYTVNKTDLMKE